MIKFEVCPHGSEGDPREMLKFEKSAPPLWASSGYAPDIDKIQENIQIVVGFYHALWSSIQVYVGVDILERSQVVR